MKSSTFEDHLLLVRGSCLILRLNSLLSVSEEKRTTLTGAGAGAGAGERAAAGLSGTHRSKGGGPAVAPTVRPRWWAVARLDGGSGAAVERG